MVHMLKMSSIWIKYYKSSTEVQISTGKNKILKNIQYPTIK
jgi:hypothetical protein